MTDTLLREENPAPGYQPAPKPQVWNRAANNGLGGWVVLTGTEEGMFIVPNTARKQDAIIPAGQTTSNPVDISTAQWIGLVWPEAMDGTTIGFEVSDSADGDFHALLFWGDPLSVSIGNAAGKAQAIGSDQTWYFMPWAYVRIVAWDQQTVERTFEIHTK